MLKINQSIDQLISENRILAILFDRVVSSPFYDENLMAKIKDYINTYLSFHKDNEIKPKDAYYRFMKSYKKDMTAFSKTGKYPLEIDPTRLAPSRYEYDVILLLSCMLADHRFRIMQIIESTCQNSQNGLFIGTGPGLELELVKSKIQNLYAYDLSIDKFVYHQHPDINFREEYFDGKNDSLQYDQVYLIELLEHLSNPYELLEQCIQVLAPNGKIYLTTATNIPQFDHLYKFESDHKDYENQVQRLGLKIEFMEDIPHQSITLDIGAKNRFYILQKK